MSSIERPGYHLPPGTLAPVDADLDRKCLARSATASVGKKYLMAAAGLFWCFFVLMHLLGNLTLFLGPDAYNGYSAKLVALGPILIVAEVLLVAALLAHAILGVVVSLENNAARPVAYEVHRAKGERNLASSTMVYSGLLVLAFLVLHLLNFKFGEHRMVGEEGHQMIDFHGLVVGLFQNPAYVLVYVVAVVVLGLHLAHALQSSLRTLGWNSEPAMARIRKLSVLFGVLAAVGYGAIPIWAILVKGARG